MSNETLRLVRFLNVRPGSAAEDYLSYRKPGTKGRDTLHSLQCHRGGVDARMEEITIHLPVYVPTLYGYDRTLPQIEKWAALNRTEKQRIVGDAIRPYPSADGWAVE